MFQQSNNLSSGQEVRFCWVLHGGRLNGQMYQEVGNVAYGKQCIHQIFRWKFFTNLSIAQSGRGTENKGGI